MEPDWVDLPAEMLILVSEKASTTNVQYVHLRAVCEAWRRALIPNPRHIPRQTPWLLLPVDGRYPFINDFHIYLYDLSQSRTHRFELPNVSGLNIIGSYYGWLVIVRHERVWLHNPITRRSIELPSLDLPPTCFVGKVVLSCNPSEHCCVVVAGWLYLATQKWELGFCRIGDTHWTEVKMRDTDKRLYDFIYDNNSVYMANTKWEVLAYDLKSLAMRTFPSKINFNAELYRIHLVEGDAEADGPLVVITIKNTLEIKVKHIYVYKWINHEQRWHRVNNIGNNVLFSSRIDCTKLQLEEQHGNEIYYVERHGMHPGFRICINKMNIQSEGILPQCSSPTKVFPTTSKLIMTLWFTLYT